jgi:hypothetical protein
MDNVKPMDPVREGDKMSRSDPPNLEKKDLILCKCGESFGDRVEIMLFLGQPVAKGDEQRIRCGRCGSVAVQRGGGIVYLNRHERRRLKSVIWKPIWKPINAGNST